MEERTKENITEIVNEVFPFVFDLDEDEVHLTIHDDLENVVQEHSGIYISVFLPTESVTRKERMELKHNGFHIVEQASHTVKNEDMDENITEINVDNIEDAAEVETELVLELSINLAGVV